MLDPRRLAIYVVTSGAFGLDRDHRSIARAAIAGGATAVQLRAAELADDELLPVATEVAAACRESGVLFVVNDRIDVAMACEGAGLHVGQDQDASVARRRLGDERVLGVSVGDAREARAAELAGADYLGVTVWETATKPEAVPRGVDGLRDIVGATSLPVVGIGGIDATNAWEVFEAGAAGVAVISAVARADDPIRAARSLVEATDRFRAARAEAGS
ncbi:MAG: thiamine phosphate synthase [Actinomycetota bacterium]